MNPWCLAPLLGNWASPAGSPAPRQVIEDREHAAGQLTGAFGFFGRYARERQRGQPWIVVGESMAYRVCVAGKSASQRKSTHARNQNGFP
jgi:hypothetical protein